MFKRHHIAIGAALVLSCAISNTYAESKFSSRSSSRSNGSSVKFNSGSRSSSNTSSSSRSSRTFNSSSNSSGSTKFNTGNGNAVSDRYSAESSKKSINSLRKIFPKQDDPKAHAESIKDKLGSNSIYNKIKDARDHFYQNHQPITQSGGNDFGLLSGIALYSLLDNDSDAAEFARNHRNDEDYLKWRAEADELAKENEELKSKLDKLDKLDDDVSTAHDLPLLNLCVGSKDGAYYKIASTHIKPPLSKIVSINLVTTKGTPDILEKLKNNTCDAGFIQGDTRIPKSVNVVFRPFYETAHMACSTQISGVNLLDFKGKDIWIPVDSGSRLTWQNMTNKLPELSGFHIRDAINTEDAIVHSMQDSACLLFMAAPHTSSLDRSINNKGLKLINISDKRLQDGGEYIVKQLYANDYNNVIQSGLFMSGSISTIASHATMVLNTDWKSAHQEAATSMTLTLLGIEHNIQAKLNQ